MADATQILDTKDYEETPEGWAQLWAAEFVAAKTNLKRWRERATEIVAQYLDERGDNEQAGTRLNLFPSNIDTLHALLAGKDPEVTAERRYADSEDDQARVASECLERMLNTDIERDKDTSAVAFKQALFDRLVAGFGIVKLRYDPGKPQIIPAQPEILPQPGMPGAPAVQQIEKRPDEYVCVEYWYWQDVLWSPCRVPNDLRWFAFMAEMSEKQFTERFGDGLWEEIPKEKKHDIVNASTDDAIEVKDSLRRVSVWEIWSKERKTVDWYVDNYEKTLDHKKDPLGLDGFWPFPRPMVANLTTTKFIPTPDFTRAQDLYREINDVSTRITLIEEAIRVAGVYNKNIPELSRLLGKSLANEMIGTDAWEAFREGGGVAGNVDWFPLEMLIGALDKLREYRQELIALEQQITGMSDIMRGQASQQTTATEQAIKARFASVRVQSLQDEFARFASDTQRLKAEIISKHFDPQTIIDRSNIMRTPDKDMAQQAAQLIKSNLFEYRISVNPDSVSLTDFAALKQERMEYAQTLAQYWQGTIPLIQLLTPIPGAALAALQFAIEQAGQLSAGMRAANEMEGTFNTFAAKIKAIAAQVMQAQQQQQGQPPKPDPKLQVAQVKAQAEMGKAKASMQGTVLDMQAHQAQHQMDMQKMAAEHAIGMQSAEAKARAQALQAVSAVTDDRGGAR